MSTSPISPMVRALLAGVTLAGAAAALPVQAQDYRNDPVYYPDSQEDIVVEGRWGRTRDDVDALSQRVSYADLDLRYAGDRRELRHRIDLTARYLCDRLGENDNSASLVPSCREAAVRDALRRVGTVEANWAPRGSGWVRPARWQAPYRDGWNN
ncbi:UrcA family protein [Sphingomonas sp. AR_OL41]|uniref:UrcA family protein n=1 Tax=Sphingomonas sp. AR_OL41 TaxID=3042729 RepID=UPI00247FB5FE|nr:UrcA family protein [Sphingomonas sp. AR_OL41]MDH7975969.1 UrcA family protein [Sphingomonas sp. AR_OL41]